MLREQVSCHERKDTREKAKQGHRAVSNKMTPPVEGHSALNKMAKCHESHLVFEFRAQIFVTHASISRPIVFVYRCLNGLACSLLQERFTLRAHGAHTAALTRGQVSAALVLPPASTLYGFSGISYVGADWWNALPPAYRLSNSPAEYRWSIKTFLGFPVRRR